MLFVLVIMVIKNSDRDLVLVNKLKWCGKLSCLWLMKFLVECFLKLVNWLFLGMFFKVGKYFI